MMHTILEEGLFNEASISQAPGRPEQMIGRPTKVANLDNNKVHASTGIDSEKRIPKDEAWLLIKLYEATVDPGNQCDVVQDVINPETGEIIGNGGISRKNLLRLCGNANYDTPGESSTFFSGAFRIFKLATIKDDIVYPGPNLKAWIENDEKVIDTMVYPDENRYRTGKIDPETGKKVGIGSVGKVFAHEPDMKRFLGKDPVGRKTPSSAASHNRPDPFQDLKGIRVRQKPEEQAKASAAADDISNYVPSSEKTKEQIANNGKLPKFRFKNTADETPVAETEPAAETPAAAPATIKWTPAGKAKTATDPEAEPVAAKPVTPNWTPKKKAANEAFDYTDKVRALYKDAMGFDEDTELTDDNFSAHNLSVICLKHGWPFAQAKAKLLGK